MPPKGCHLQHWPNDVLEVDNLLVANGGWPLAHGVIQTGNPAEESSDRSGHDILDHSQA